MWSNLMICGHVFFLSWLSLSFTSRVEDPYSGDGNLNVNLKIEPTPVLVKGPSSATSYALRWVRGPQLDTWNEGSGRGKRDYNLEDFLVWMPSGDGREEPPRISTRDRSTQHTKTVYVTTTKYKTMYASRSINSFPTQLEVFQTKEATNSAKDIFSSTNKWISTQCNPATLPFFKSRFNFTAPLFGINRERFSTSSTEQKIFDTKTTLPFEDHRKITTSPSNDKYPDIKEFLHSSLGYEGPTTGFYQYSTAATPALPTRVKESSSFDIMNSLFLIESSVFPSSCSSAQFGCPSIELPHAFTSEVFSLLPSSRLSSKGKSKTISTTLTTFPEEIFDPYPHTTGKLSTFLSTKKTSFTFPTTEKIDTSSIPIYEDLLAESSKLQTQHTRDQTLESTISVFPTPEITTEGKESSLVILTTLPKYDEMITTSETKDSCNCTRTTDKAKLTPTPTLPDMTTPVSSIVPSPSNNATVPLDKRLWIRTVMSGQPKSPDDVNFKNDMTKKLTRAYQYAYELSSIKNREKGYFEDQTLTSQRSRKLAKRSIWKYPEIILSNQDFFHENNISHLTRTKRQDSSNISVRIQNITYHDSENATELVYSVFVGDTPLLAADAVEKMKKVNDTVLENILEYALNIKAEEYVKPEVLHEKAGNYDHIMLSTLIITSTGFTLMFVFIGCFIYKKFKRKSSAAGLREGSQNYLTSRTGLERRGFNDYDEESTPEDSGTRRQSPEMDADSLSRPSTAQEIGPFPRSALLPSSRRKDAEDGRLEREDGRMQPTEHVYSIPKPLSQIQSNIQVVLDHARFKQPMTGKEKEITGGFIPGTSLPRFLPPPRPQLPIMRSPPTEIEGGLPSPRVRSPEDTMTRKKTDQPSQERQQSEQSASTTSRGASELETISETPLASNGVGLGRLRRRFHDLLDDAFSLMHGQKSSDKVTPLATPFLMRKSRSRSAVPQGRPQLLDDIENGAKLESDKPHAHFRPWSAAAIVHSPRDPLSIYPSGESSEVSPRSAWGDHGRSITPVNLPTRGLNDRPDSAPLGRSSRELLRSPTPIDPETGLRMCDPAVPLIRAIKDELSRFKSTVNTDSSSA